MGTISASALTKAAHSRAPANQCVSPVNETLNMNVTLRMFPLQLTSIDTFVEQQVARHQRSQQASDNSLLTAETA